MKKIKAAPYNVLFIEPFQTFKKNLGIVCLNCFQLVVNFFLSFHHDL